MNTTLEDEITSINAIYTPTTLTVSTPTSTTLLDTPNAANEQNSNTPTTATATATPSLLILQLPAVDISLRLEFPPDYPARPPVVLGPHGSGEARRKGEASDVVERAREVLERVFVVGGPCVYDLVEELSGEGESGGHVHVSGDGGGGEGGGRDGRGKEGGGETMELREAHFADSGELTVGAEYIHQNANPTHPTSHSHSHPHSEQRQTPKTKVSPTTSPTSPLTETPHWTLSQVITEKKSTFLARVSRTTSPSQARASIHHLLSTDKKASKATHNITAWRIRGRKRATTSTSTSTSGAEDQDQDRNEDEEDEDSDGESAAGTRLLHLLQVMDVWNVVVVVTRWYGGVHLGADRFRIINAVARDALGRAGVVGKEGEREKGRR